MPSLINADMLDTSPPEWTIDGIIPRVGFGIMHGPSYSGKSLVADTELALAIGNGTPFFGRQSVTGCVVVGLGEGLYDAGVRLEGRLARQIRDNEQKLRKVRDADARDAARAALPPYDSERLFMLTSPFTIPVKQDGQPSEGLAHAIAQMRIIPDLELVVIDALSDFSGGLSISNDTSANRMVLGLKHMVRELDCVVLAVHHNTSDNKKMIGAGRLFNAADFVIEIVPDETSPDEPKSSTMVCRKSKYGPEFDPMSYQIETLEWTTRDEETGETAEVKSATVRMQADEQSTPGSRALRLPGDGTARARELPDVRDAIRPRKRRGIKSGRSWFGRKRNSLVDNLMAEPCPCGAEPGVTCQDDGSEISLLTPGIYAHTKRIVSAIVSGRATVEEVVAQYGENPPAGLADPLSEETMADITGKPVMTRHAPKPAPASAAAPAPPDVPGMAEFGFGAVTVDDADDAEPDTVPDIPAIRIPEPVTVPDIPAMKLCECGCGEQVTSPRPEARYATPACRNRAYRRAKGGKK